VRLLSSMAFLVATFVAVNHAYAAPLAAGDVGGSFEGDSDGGSFPGGEASEEDADGVVSAALAFCGYEMHGPNFIGDAHFNSWTQIAWSLAIFEFRDSRQASEFVVYAVNLWKRNIGRITCEEVIAEAMGAGGITTSCNRTRRC
jgi:hypothetical protein